MREVERKKAPKNNQKKFSGKPEKRDHIVQNKSSNRKALKAEDTKVKVPRAKGHSVAVVSDSNTGSESSEVYENMVVDYADDIQKSEEGSSDIEKLSVSEKVINEKTVDHSHDIKNEPMEEMEEGSDTDTNYDSVSSQGDLAAADDEKVERTVRVHRIGPKSDSSDGSSSQSERMKADQKNNTNSKKALKSTQKKSINPEKDPSEGESRDISDGLKNMKVHPKPMSDASEVAGKPIVESKEEDVQDGNSNSVDNVDSDDDVMGEANGEKEGDAIADQKIHELESRIEKLEEELREVAALEVSLYSVVPEHGSSAHKVHTPARRLCRLYIHACKHWSPNKRATVARNTVSGLILIAKSCGHDVPRLSFWLSNTVVLREIITQTFPSSCQSGPLTKIFESNGGKNSATKSPSHVLKSSSSSNQPKRPGSIQLVDDWQETATFTAALEKVESWIFSRIVESIWWQSLTPHMQSHINDQRNIKVVGRVLGPILGDQQQGSYSVNLWKNAFEDALRRLCPVRAEGHECGCLPVLARKVMEQCLARLDVAMFNAILRESAHEIPTDPVSDPIVDSRVLPIPAGDLSFGSGAQLKNSVGNWSRCLDDLFGMGNEDANKETGDEPKCFNLLNALSDLLMLPKDMIMDKAVRMEVCPQISLPLLKRILCNFTPDEFCPDAVPGAVLEALNAECIIERRLSGDSASSFPYPAAPVVYTAPSAVDVAEKIAEAGGKSQLSRTASAIQRKGYTSEEDLVELDCPLAAIVDKIPPSPTNQTNGSGKGDQGLEKETGDNGGNNRYALLSEVWRAT